MTEQVKQDVVDLGEHYFHVGNASVAKVTGFITDERLTLDVAVSANCIPVALAEDRDEETEENLQAMRDQGADMMVEYLKKFIAENGGEVSDGDFKYIGQELKSVTE
ncbi:hypothetical protein [Aeromonas phage Akh-2]|nr:hypothetical protein [Aeromonas phage Akh-2]